MRPRSGSALSGGGERPPKIELKPFGRMLLLGSETRGVGHCCSLPKVGRKGVETFRSRAYGGREGGGNFLCSMPWPVDKIMHASTQKWRMFIF